MRTQAREGIKINKLTIAAASISFVLLAGCVITTDNTWRPAKKYTHTSEFDTALVAAKDWVLSNKQGASERLLYEYSIRRYKELIEVSIREITIKSNGERFVAMDGDVCIYINNDGSVVNTKQCYAP